jgi:hypothetical protein
MSDRTNDLRLGENGQDTASDLADLATLSNVSPGEDSVNLDDLRMPQDFQESGDTKPIWTSIPIRKPKWPHFVRVHPNSNFCFTNACTIHDKDENEFCLISNRMLSELCDRARLTNLFLTINQSGMPFVWPVILPGPDGRWNSWHRSAAEVAELAKEKWIQLEPKRDLGGYLPREPRGKLPEPIWPDLTPEEVFKVAFKGFIIRDAEHPFYKRIFGIR